MPDSGDTLEAVRGAASWFETDADGLSTLSDAIGDAGGLLVVGEAAHGTDELHRTRADLDASLDRFVRLLRDAGV